MISNFVLFWCVQHSLSCLTRFYSSKYPLRQYLLCFFGRFTHTLSKSFFFTKNRSTSSWLPACFITHHLWGLVRASKASSCSPAVLNSSPRAPPLCIFRMLLLSLQMFVLFERKCPAKWTSQDIPPWFQFEANVNIPFKVYWNVQDVN